MPFTPHITPQSYYDELSRASAAYVRWINTPRDREAPPLDFLPKPLDKTPTKAEIKKRLLYNL